MSEDLNRRDFLKAAAIADGPAVISAREVPDTFSAMAMASRSAATKEPSKL